MSNVIDIDALFEKFIRDYMKKNAGKYTEEEWESKIPELYSEFGATAMPELDGKTPETYFEGVSGQDLVETFLSCLENGISVSDFLCEAIVSSSDTEKPLLKVLVDSVDEETVMYVLNMLSDKGTKAVLPQCIEYILDGGVSVNVKDVCAEIISNYPDDVKDKLIRLYNDGGEEEKEYFVDILSRCKQDDGVFAVLMDAFATHTDKMSYYASLLARYGDDRALPLLYEAIETNVDYAEFTELKFAIEKLGGEYNKKRDFSNDKYYKKIMNKKS